jgi:hypothetical protein
MSSPSGITDLRAKPIEIDERLWRGLTGVAGSDTVFAQAFFCGQIKNFAGFTRDDTENL